MQQFLYLVILPRNSELKKIPNLILICFTCNLNRQTWKCEAIINKENSMRVQGCIEGRAGLHDLPSPLYILVLHIMILWCKTTYFHAINRSNFNLKINYLMNTLYTNFIHGCFVFNILHLEYIIIITIIFNEIRHGNWI